MLHQGEKYGITINPLKSLLKIHQKNSIFDIESVRENIYKNFSEFFVKANIDKHFFKNFQMISLFYGKFLFEDELSALKNSNSTPEELELEYNRLFYGPGELLCPPYESIYKEKKLFGKATLEVINIYGKYDFQLNKEITEIPDHIALELEFMSFLCKNKLLQGQLSFLKEHLMPFVKKFYEVLEDCARIDLYKNIAKLLVKFVMVDKEYINFLLSQSINK